MAIFWELQPLWSSLLTKPNLLRFKCFSGHGLSETKSVTPNFFTFLKSPTHHLLMIKFSEKKSMLENFHANVLEYKMLSSVILKTTALCLKLCSTDLGYILRPFSSLQAKKHLHKSETQPQKVHKSTENVNSLISS